MSHFRKHAYYCHRGYQNFTHVFTVCHNTLIIRNKMLIPFSGKNFFCGDCESFLKLLCFTPVLYSKQIVNLGGGGGIHMFAF